jgi:phospholipid/cholesterol/gamma-HCH transport system substrate-binding protein
VSAEAKVGMFFLIAVIIVGVIALFLGDFWVRARSQTITVYFENIQGLTNGAEVRMAGVKIGRVTAVTLTDNPKFPKRPAAVRMAVYRDVMLFDADVFAIQQGALLGDKYVEVQRSQAMPKQRIANGAEVAGGQARGIEDLTEEARALVKEARDALAAVRGGLATEQNMAAIKVILVNMMGATAKADVLAAEGIRMAALLTAQARQAGPNVQRMAANMAKASESVKDTAALVRQMLVTSTLPRDAQIATANLRDISQNFSAISDSFAQVLATPETRGKMQDALDNMHTATQNLAKVSAQAQKLLGDDQVAADMKQALARMRETADHLANISRSYDKILTDPKFQDDLQGTLSAARQAAEAGNRTLEKTDAELDRLDRTLTHVTKVTRSLSPDDVRARISLQNSSHEGLQANADIDLQYGKNPNNFWRVGMRGMGDDNQINAQRSLPMGPNRMRIGLFSSQPGIGYDYHPDQRLSAEAELWNPRNVHFDLRGGYKVMPQIDVLFGFNDIGGQNDPFVGVRYKSK